VFRVRKGQGGLLVQGLNRNEVGLGWNQAEGKGGKDNVQGSTARPEVILATVQWRNAVSTLSHEVPVPSRRDRKTPSYRGRCAVTHDTRNCIASPGVGLIF